MSGHLREDEMSSLQTNDEATPLLSRAIAERALALRTADVPSDVWRYLKPVSYTHLTLPTNREV